MLFQKPEGESEMGKASVKAPEFPGRKPRFRSLTGQFGGFALLSRWEGGMSGLGGDRRLQNFCSRADALSTDDTRILSAL